MLRGRTAIGWNAKGCADSLFRVVKWICICHRISVQAGGTETGSVLWWQHMPLKPNLTEYRFFFFLRCIKFVHRNPVRVTAMTPDHFPAFWSGCTTLIYFLLSGGSSDSECGASDFTLMLLRYQFVHCRTAGAFLFLECVGMEFSWPGEEKRSKLRVKLNLSHWHFPPDFFDLLKSHDCLTES